MTRSWVFSFCAVLAACGQGVSEDPLASDASGGAERGGVGGVASAPGAGGVATGGTAPAAGTGGADGVGGAGSGGASATGGVVSGTGGAPPGMPTGSPDCNEGSDCASGQCLEDVSGVSRCCADDCAATGRVCSATGGCVCPSVRTERDGECLLVQGQPCLENGDCASNSCVDGVCCDAPCDGVCERCDASGACTLDADDASCPAPFECAARNRCRLPLGESCDSAVDCESEKCEAADSGKVCCATECRGACKTCSPAGTCDDFPSSDESCPAVTCAAPTTCLSYRPPTPDACSGHGQCGQCEPVYTRPGVACGIGKQCDGEGSCVYTGLGRFAAGDRHTCAIRNNGSVACWGDNSYGQLGGLFDEPPFQIVGDDELPSQPPGLEIDFGREVWQVAAGVRHSCALFEDGAVRCWGSYDHPVGVIYTVFGHAPLTPRVLEDGRHVVEPLATNDVRLSEPATQISAAAGGSTVCALLESGKVSCWGLNGYGNLGIGHTNSLNLANLSLIPSVDLGVPAIEVRAGFAHTCALLEDGNVNCWGEAIGGRLGSGDGASRYSPREAIDIGEPVKNIAVGFGHTCAVLRRGALRCWGLNGQGQLGYGHTAIIGDDETPAAAATLPGPAGRAVLGGDVPVGGLVSQVVILAMSPQIIASPETPGIPEYGGSATCALLTTGLVRCWGQNDYGQLGYGHNESGAAQKTPAELAIEARPPFGFWGGDVDIGGEAMALPEGGRCALRTQDDLLYCWGRNSYGEVGVPSAFPTGSLSLRPKAYGPTHWW